MAVVGSREVPEHRIEYVLDYCAESGVSRCIAGILDNKGISYLSVCGYSRRTYRLLIESCTPLTGVITSSAATGSARPAPSAVAVFVIAPLASRGA